LLFYLGSIRISIFLLSIQYLETVPVGSLKYCKHPSGPKIEKIKYIDKQNKPKSIVYDKYINDTFIARKLNYHILRKLPPLSKSPHAY